MDTTNYMILGFIVIFAVLFVHLASFAVRNRNFQHDLKMLEGLQRRPTKKRAKSTKRKTSRRKRSK